MAVQAEIEDVVGENLKKELSGIMMRKCVNSEVRLYVFRMERSPTCSEYRINVEGWVGNKINGEE